MKPYTYFYTLIICLVAGNSLLAQGHLRKTGWSIPEQPLSFSGSQRSKIISEDGTPLYLNDLNTKAVADFKTRFNNVDGEIWQKKANGEFVATFKQNNRSYMVWYNSRGKWESTMKGYKEIFLPFEVRDLVKRNYYDYTIYYINEVVTLQGGNAPTYLVYIQFKNEFKIIRVKNGEMDIWQQMTKR